MAQDEIPEQEMLVVQDELPQPDPEPEMGAAAAAAYDTSPSLLHQNLPPILAESTQPGALDMILQAISGMNNKMDGMTQTLREEIQYMGAGLQDGLDKVKKGQDQ